MFSAADAPSAPKPSDQVAKQATAAPENSKQLVTLQDLREFQSGQQKFQDTPAQSSTSDLNTYQSETHKTNESKIVDDILGSFDLTNNASDKSQTGNKTKTDTTTSLSDREIAAILKDSSAKQISASLSDLLKDLSAQNSKTAVPNDSHTANGAQQHRNAYSTKEAQTAEHHRDDDTTHEAKQASHHRDAYSTIEAQKAEHHRDDSTTHENKQTPHHRDAYSTIEAQTAEKHRDDHKTHEAKHTAQHRDEHVTYEPHTQNHRDIQEAPHHRDVETLHGRTRTHDVPAIPPDQFAEVAKRVIAKVGHNGEVTRDDLAKAMQDPTIKGQDAQALAAMYYSFDNLHNLTGHELFPWNPETITTGDVDKFQQIQAEHSSELSDVPQLGKWAAANLTKFAGDGHTLSHNDVEQALKNPNISSQDLNMLLAIDVHWSEMTSFLHPNVSVKDVNDFVNNFNKEGSLIGNVGGDCQYIAARGQTAEMSHDLYAADPIECIRQGDVRQGTVGDCYFEATVAGLARSNPELIKNMIHDNQNGTYSVKFPGMAPDEQPITVNAPTEAEMGLYNGGSKYGCWATVLEKAYGQYRENHQNDHPVETPEQGGDGGGNPRPIFKLLTGKDPIQFTTKDTSEAGVTPEAHVAQELHQALDGKSPYAVTANIPNGPGPENLPDGFYRNHVYTITAINNVKGQEMITIRNPWGYDVNGVKGTLTIPISEFMQDFNQISIGGGR